MQQGSYPIGSRTLVGSDTVTGVVTGTTADIPLSMIATMANLLGVTSFNTRTGAVGLTSSDVGTALGYTAASLVSPVLTGTPQAPTATAGTNNSQIATTQFVTTAVAGGAGGGGGAASGVTYAGTNLGAILASSSVTVVNTVTALRSVAHANYAYAQTKCFAAPGDNGGNLFYYDSTDTTSADNGATVVVASDGGRWKPLGKDSVTSANFGVDNTGAADSTTAFVAHFAQRQATGGLLQIPAGYYKISQAGAPAAAMSLTYVGVVSAEPVSVPNRTDIVGQGRGNTVLFNMTASKYGMSITGGTGVQAHGHDTVRDIGFGGVSTSYGLYVFDKAYTQFVRLGFWGLAQGTVLESVLSSAFDSCLWNSNVIGLILKTGTGFSEVNAVTFRQCIWGANTGLGIQGFANQTQLSFHGGSIEGNGTMGNSSTGGAVFTFDGGQGAAGVTFEGTYFENNAGGADVTLNNTGSNTVTCTFVGCNFNRISSTNYVTNNILATGNINIVLVGCSFTGYNSYAASAGRLYVNAGAGVTVTCIGCSFGSSLEQGTLTNVVSGNFVDLTTNQTIGGTKSFTGVPVAGKWLVSGAANNIGDTSTRITGVNSEGGSYALSLSNSSQNMEVYCTPGVIGSYTTANTETVLRPLYAIVSSLIADLRGRKIL